MKVKKPKNVESDDESLPYIIGTGSFDSFTAIPKDDKPKKRRRIGFIKDRKAPDKK